MVAAETKHNACPHVLHVKVVNGGMPTLRMHLFCTLALKSQ
jgi:hypothetical protein